jgi:hypothetical protein
MTIPTTRYRYFLGGKVGVGRARGPGVKRFSAGVERLGDGEVAGWVEVFGFWGNFLIPSRRAGRS